MKARTFSSMDLSRTDLLTQRDSLVNRLNEGDRQITMARVHGADTARLEALWIRLLRDYEAISRMLDQRDGERLATAA